MSYGKSIVFWAVVLCLVGFALAGWAPWLVTLTIGDAPSVGFVTVEQLAQPEVARAWIGYTGLRIFGALLLGLGAALGAASRLESTEARRVVLVGLAWASSLTALMALVQVQAILSVFTPRMWLVPVTAALLLAHSLWLLLRLQKPISA
ncbi:MAG: hypothetical protein AAF690_06980 [Acidobacteriota bacterium]